MGVKLLVIKYLAILSSQLVTYNFMYLFSLSALFGLPNSTAPDWSKTKEGPPTHSLAVLHSATHSRT
jgi:hypothetical protein